MAVNLNETATLTLKSNSKDLSNELTQLDTKAKELRRTLKEIEQNGGKGSEEWKKYRTELQAVQTETKNLKKDVDVTTLTYGQLQSRIKDLTRDLKGLTPGTEAFIKTAKNLGQAEAQFKKVNAEVKTLKDGGDDLGKPTLWSKITSGVGTVQKAFQAFIALQIIGFVIDIGKAIFETTSKFEKYGKVLETALGSQKEAQESLAALKKLGSETAFSVDELTDGYVKMVNRGLRPSQKEMVAMTDLAASQGKTFDQLVEAALDAQTGEFERLKEFGMKASKEGDNVTLSFKGMNQTVKNTPEAIQGAIVAFGQMKGVAGQNAEMMKTLDGQTSNLGDNFDSLKVEIGTQLRPVFVAILSTMSGGITVISGLVKVIGSLISVVSSYWSTLGDFAVGSAGVMKNMGSAIKEFLSGNFEAASKAWDQTKAAGAKVVEGVKANIKKGAAEVVAIWSDPANTQKAEFAGKTQGKAHGDALTAEQKKALEKQAKEAEKARKKEEKEEEKHLEEIKKANEKALEELAKIEAEAHIASIKDDMQREFVKLMAKRDQEAEAILKTVADEKNKNAQIAALDKKLQIDINNVAAEYAEKKRKKAEDEEQKRLAAEKAIIEQERQAYSALLDWREFMAKGNATKLNAIHKEREDTNYRLTLEKLNAEEAAERAKAAREITNETQFEAAIFAIDERYTNERQLLEKQHANEIERINKELQEKKNAQWTNASNAFSALLKGDLNSFVDYASKIFEGEQSAWQKRLANNMAKYEAVGQMAQAAVSFLNQLEQQKADRAIAEAQRERDEKVKLLNEQIQLEKAAEDAAEFEKQKITQESNDKIESIKSSSEKTISDLENQYRQLSSTEEKKKLDEQLSSYRENGDGKKASVKETTEAAIEANNEEAEQSIAAAQKAEKAAITAATNTKLERIDAAEATRDAEIAAINKRKDVDDQTRKQLLAEAKAAFDTEKKLAEDEAQAKIEAAKETAKTQTELAKETAKTKNELAKDNQEAELKAIEAIQKGDEKAAKEILAKAKEDQKEKIRLAKEQADKAIEEAEKEKREKLKKVEAEKQTRIQNQKELNRQIEAENAKARATEAAAKRKAWEAQKKADIASALITGALATLKALASAFWPANLVFAALSAVMTGVQVAMIKSQPAPQFRHGGFIAQGGRHGSSYGSGGIALVDRASSREVGEMEGDEAIISREQTAANRGFIEQMFSNARNPSRRNKPILTDRPPAFREGGLFSAPYWSKSMHLFGGIKSQPKRYYADGGYNDTYSDSSLDSGYDYAQSDVEIAQQQGKEQLKLLQSIIDALKLSDKTNADGFKQLDSSLLKAVTSIALQNKVMLDTLESANKTRFATLSADLVKAINTNGESIVKALNNSTNDNGKSLESLSLQQKLSFSLLNTNLNKGFTTLSTDTGKGFEGLSKNVVNAIEKLSKQTENNLEELSNDVVNAIEAQSDESSDLIKAQTLQLTAQHKELTVLLSLLQRDKVKVLEKQFGLTAKSLEELDKDLVNALEELAQSTELSLESLSKKTTNALGILSSDTKQGLSSLAVSTKQGLDNMAYQVSSLRSSINGVEYAVSRVEGATRGVEGAVYGTNQAGRLEALIGAISSFGGKK